MPGLRTIPRGLEINPGRARYGDDDRVRRAGASSSRVAECDLEDAVYLACAVDGRAHLITTEDSDLRSLGDEQEGVRILSWDEFRAHLRRLGLLTAR